MDLTYPEVGATRHGELPTGYNHIRHERRLSVPFEVAAEALMTWQTHYRTGLRPRPTVPRVAMGAEVLCNLGPLRAPCRVVWVVEEPDRVGWAYGTLPGHPEIGEESFLLTRNGDGVKVTITAFSRPGHWLTRLAGPAVPPVQRFYIRLYARALDRTP